MIGIFGKIKAKKFPAVHQKMFIVGSLTADPGKLDQAIILRKDGEAGEILRMGGEIIIPSDKKQVQTIGEITNLPIKSSGKYRIEMYLNGKLQENTAEFLAEEM